jgi:predicted transcriptional regulator
MDIQTEKIELAKMILSTNDLGLISQIKSLFKSKEENWWDELPANVKQGISESLEQADRGEFISYDEVKKEVSALLKK